MCLREKGNKAGCNQWPTENCCYHTCQYAFSRPLGENKNALQIGNNTGKSYCMCTTTQRCPDTQISNRC